MMNTSNMIQLTSHQPHSFSLLQDSSFGKSGTEGFDFFNALLGLQTSSEATPSQLFEQGLISSDSNQEILESDKTLLEVFGKKKGFDEINSQIFVFGSSLPGDSQLALKSSADKNPLDVESISKQTDLSKELQRKANPLSVKQVNSLEDPLEKLTFEAGLKHSKENQPVELQKMDKNSQLLSLQQKSKQVASFQSPFKMSASALGKVETEDTKTSEAVQTGDFFGKSDHEIKKKEARDNETLISEALSENRSIPDQNEKLEVSDKKFVPVSVPEVFQKVDSLVHEGGGKMTLSLTPPELGQVEIQVVTKGKNVEIKVKSESDFAKTAIENQLGDLQQSLQNQDLNLSKIEVQVTKELSPSFMENQFAGFFQNGNNSYRNAGAYQERENQGTPWERRSSGSQPRSIASVSTAEMPLRSGYRETGRVDIRI